MSHILSLMYFVPVCFLQSLTLPQTQPNNYMDGHCLIEMQLMKLNKDVSFENIGSQNCKYVNLSVLLLSYITIKTYRLLSTYKSSLIIYEEIVFSLFLYYFCLVLLQVNSAQLKIILLSLYFVASLLNMFKI